MAPSATHCHGCTAVKILEDDWKRNDFYLTSTLALVGGRGLDDKYKDHILLQVSTQRWGLEPLRGGFRLTKAFPTQQQVFVLLIHILCCTKSG